VTAAPKLAAPLPLADLLRHEGDATKHIGDRPFAWHVDPRAERPDVLAFDLAAEGGWFFLGAQRRASGPVIAREARIDAAWSAEIDACLERAVASSKDWSRLLVVVEDTHLGSAARTPLAFAAVTRYGAAVSTLCAQRRLTCIRVPAQAWQSRVLGKIRRDQGKTLSLAKARSMFGGAITSDHVADAALLALYVRGRA
jgi:hypothetical protein